MALILMLLPETSLDIFHWGVRWSNLFSNLKSSFEFSNLKRPSYHWYCKVTQITTCEPFPSNRLASPTDKSSFCSQLERAISLDVLGEVSMRSGLTSSTMKADTIHPVLDTQTYRLPFFRTILSTISRPNLKHKDWGGSLEPLDLVCNLLISSLVCCRW